MNGIPQLMVPKASSAVGSITALAQGLALDYLKTELRWGVYEAGTSNQVVLGQSSSVLDKVKNGSGASAISALINGDLKGGKNYIDSVIALSHRKGADVSQYRLETGSFANYNKVEKPRIIPIRLVKGGTESERGQFLTWLETNSKLTTLFDIAVPEVTYPDLTLVDYSITRESKSGVTLVIADCMFQEVMQITFEYTNSKTKDSKNAQDKPTVKNRTVQTNPPSQGPLSKLGKIASKVGSLF